MIQVGQTYTFQNAYCHPFSFVVVSDALFAEATSSERPGFWALVLDGCFNNLVGPGDMLIFAVDSSIAEDSVRFPEER